jgi:hypothetical protein
MSAKGALPYMTKRRRVAYILILIGVVVAPFLLFDSATFEHWTGREDESAGDAALTDVQLVEHENSKSQILWIAEIPGHKIEIEWREPQEREVISAPFGQHVHPLTDRAMDGDAKAALLLYQILEECRSAFDSRNVLEESIENLRQTHSIQLPSWDQPYRMNNPEALEQFIEVTEHEFEICFPITRAQKNESGKWLQMAVDGGNDLAILYYANQAGSPEEAISLLERTWRNGHPESLKLLADSYLEAYNDGSAPEGHIDSLAAQYAYALLLWESSKFHAHGSLSEYQSAVSKLTDMSERMYEHERNEAIERATALLESNQNCCIIF